MSKRPKFVGRCKVCGCTDDHGCVNGCSWVDPHHTLCSECDKWATRATKARADRPSKIPVYGLWIVDGGPKGRGHWLIDTYDGSSEFPAVFFDRKSAQSAADRECGEGLDVVVVELRAHGGVV